VGNHLLLLQSAPISVILLVLTPYTNVGPTSKPVMTVAVAPPMDTICGIALGSDLGLLFEDI
jgi:hypothetical protein